MMAAARQKEMKLSMAVVATRTRGRVAVLALGCSVGGLAMKSFRGRENYATETNLYASTPAQCVAPITSIFA